MDKQKMLIVCAHVGDFVWRSGGAIAKYTSEGHEVHIIALTFGARGESNGYWKKGGTSVEECRSIRRKEAEQAAGILGVSNIEFCDYEDYPLTLDIPRIERLARRICEIRPDFILTHDRGPDPFNPDHNLTAQAVCTAYAIASGAGSFAGELPVAPRQTPMFGFEPHMTEISSFTPGIYIDITDVFDIKKQAMEAMPTQANMPAHYIRKAQIRASECANRGGVSGCKYAEAFSSFGPVYAHGHFVW